MGISNYSANTAQFAPHLNPLEFNENRYAHLSIVRHTSQQVILLQACSSVIFPRQSLNLLPRPHHQYLQPFQLLLQFPTPGH